MAALEAKYCNDVGFNYTSFLEDLQPEEKRELMYVKRLEDIRAANQTGKLPEKRPGKDLESILLKIKTKVRHNSTEIDWND